MIKAVQRTSQGFDYKLNQFNKQYKQREQLIQQIQDIVQQVNLSQVLHNPQSLLKSKQLVQFFTFIIPNMKTRYNNYKGTTVSKIIAARQGSQSWIAFDYNSQLGNSGGITIKIIPKYINNHRLNDGTKILKAANAAKLQIQEIKINNFIGLFYKIYMTDKMVLTPTIMFSSLLFYFLMVQDQFSSTPIQEVGNKNKFQFTIQINQNNVTRILDMFNFKMTFPNKIGVLKNKVGTQINSLLQTLKGQTFQDFQKQYQQIDVNQKQADRIYKTYVNSQQQLVNQQVIARQKKQDQSKIKNQETQNLKESALQLYQKVQSITSNDEITLKNNIKSTQSIQIIVPKLDLQQLKMQTQLNLTTKFFRSQLPNLKYSLDQSILNLMPKQISTQILFIQTRRLIKQKQLQANVAVTLAQLKKLAFSKKISQRNFLQLIKKKQMQFSQLLYQNIQIPINTMQVLVQRGKRLNQQVRSNTSNRNQIINQVKNLFTENSPASKLIKSQISRLNLGLTAVYTQLANQKFMYSGLPEQIQKTSFNLLKQLQRKINTQTSIQFTNLNSQISQLSRMSEIRSQSLQEKMTRFTDSINIQLSQIKNTLSKISAISEQIAKINVHLTKIQETMQQNYGYIIQSLSNFMQKLGQEGIKGFAPSQQVQKLQKDALTLKKQYADSMNTLMQQQAKKYEQVNIYQEGLYKKLVQSSKNVKTSQVNLQQGLKNLTKSIQNYKFPQIKIPQSSNIAQQMQTNIKTQITKAVSQIQGLQKNIADKINKVRIQVQNQITQNKQSKLDKQKKLQQLQAQIQTNKQQSLKKLSTTIKAIDTIIKQGITQNQVNQNKLNAQKIIKDTKNVKLQVDKALNTINSQYFQKGVEGIVSKFLKQTQFQFDTSKLQLSINKAVDPGSYTFQKSSLQKKIDETLNPGSYKFETSSLQNKIGEILNPSGYTFNTKPLQSSIDQVLNPTKYTFSKENLQKSINQIVDPSKYDFAYRDKLQTEISRSLNPTSYVFSTQNIQKSINESYNDMYSKVLANNNQAIMALAPNEQVIRNKQINLQTNIQNAIQSSYNTMYSKIVANNNAAVDAVAPNLQQIRKRQTELQTSISQVLDPSNYKLNNQQLKSFIQNQYDSMYSKVQQNNTRIIGQVAPKQQVIQAQRKRITDYFINQMAEALSLQNSKAIQENRKIQSIVLPTLQAINSQFQQHKAINISQLSKVLQILFMNISKLNGFGNQQQGDTIMQKLQKIQYNISNVTKSIAAQGQQSIFSKQLQQTNDSQVQLIAYLKQSVLQLAQFVKVIIQNQVQFSDDYLQSLYKNGTIANDKQLNNIIKQLKKKYSDKMKYFSDNLIGQLPKSNLKQFQSFKRENIQQMDAQQKQYFRWWTTANKKINL